MSASWEIRHWPRCEYHAFLSHCAEDRERLVLPLREELEKRGILSWVDKHHYPLGTGPFEALREGLLKCRHVIYLVSPAALAQGRGWMAIEKALTDLIQCRLRDFDRELCHIELPLFLVPAADPVFNRSIWRTIQDRGRFITGRTSRRSRVIAWAADQIETFVHQEELRASDIIQGVKKDRRLFKLFAREENLLRRLAAADPQPIG